MMSNLQPLFYVGIPTLLILAGLFFNWSAANGIRSEVKDVRTDLRSEIKDLRTDLRAEINGVRTEVRDLRTEMYSRFADQDKRLEEIKSSNHKDALEIMRQMTSLHERVAVVESKQK